MSVTPHHGRVPAPNPPPSPLLVELEHICAAHRELLKALATCATLLADIKDLLTRIDGRGDRLEAGRG